MEFDPLILSRIQFAFTIGYHIVFPTLSIGLAWFLAILRTLEYLNNRPGKAFAERPIYRRAFDFWLRIFGLSFGMGVVSGVVLSYEIGTNWGRFSEIAGPVVGPLMSFEVLSAFFLEAGFLGIMLIGRRRVNAKLHLFSTYMVAIGTLLSAFWILSANSFMHTPAGYEVVDGIIMPADWLAAIFNPSFPYRFTHMIVASLLTTSFVIAAVGASYALKSQSAAGKHKSSFGRDMTKVGLILASILTPLQIFVGDMHGLNTLEHQPMKVAAMEGHWHTSGNVPLILFAIPDEENETNHYEVSVPNLSSLILTHTLDGEVKGLTEVAPEQRPPVTIVFFSFRIMIGIGLLMLAMSWGGLFLLWRKKLFVRSRLSQMYLWCLKWMWPTGFIAILAGWTTTEVGRQPWLVNGLLYTKDGSSLVEGANVALTLTTFIVVYALFFAIFLIFVRYFIRKGPGELPNRTIDSMGHQARPAFMVGEEEDDSAAAQAAKPSGGND